MRRTDFAADRRKVLRGSAAETIDEIADESLDLVYIDGDHTLRGIVVDLLSSWPKLRPGGIIVGDDFSPTIWQHPDSFEPTLVFPFAVHFAEARKAPIVAAPNNQFILLKPEGSQSTFTFIDREGLYPRTALLDQIDRRPRRVSRIGRISRRVRRALLGG
jgi:hypothetical protein